MLTLRRVAILLISVQLQCTPGITPPRSFTDWRHYGGGSGGTRYSNLGGIDENNIGQLEIAWRWSSPDNEIVEREPRYRPFVFEATPLAVRGVLYTSTSLSLLAAIDGRSGKTLWQYDPGSYPNGTPSNVGYVTRGVAYHERDDKRRIFLATGDAFLISIDADSGMPDPQFGQGGRVDLTLGLGRSVQRSEYAVTSPPVVMRNTVIVGSSIPDGAVHRNAPPGHVRGFDADSGELKWIFHTVPQEGEFGWDTWGKGAYRDHGHTNVWSIMTADEETGYVYLPIGTPTNDTYGGQRPGDNLFAESLVCLEAQTGRRVWHYQITHHGLWDYDLPAAPILVDLEVDGETVPSVVQVTKQGFAFVFNRLTGKPIWPIEERPVPTSDVAGELTSPTQPFPTRPPPFERQGMSPDDLIDFTPKLRLEAEAILAQLRHGPLYTPPSLRGTVNLPGNSGGASWAGAAVDPEDGSLFVPSITAPFVLQLEAQEDGDFDFRFAIRTGPTLVGPRGLPITKPPYSRVTAINLNRGETSWMVPLGEGPRDHPMLSHLSLPRLGSGARGFVLATSTLLFLAEGPSTERMVAGILQRPFVDCCQNRPRLLALKKDSGDLIWEKELPLFPTGSPMMYSVDGIQYLVFAAGGMDAPAELIALATSRDPS